ncbi:slipin family protein [Luteolibacter flavescens]|uniref:Slipin family protein n=1 Tax=Luteolibacter flavescens TaxID=1859460 RepID=A0ABT3FIC9_9BACT|nr:slipin family protein [Luteolibacter flavescens]MCW1883317.1 slipin family protein [Luteolibacter flavescens]
MNPIIIVSLFVTACVALIAWNVWVTTVVVRQHEAALLFQHGKLVRTLAAGRHWFLGTGYEVKRFDIRRSDLQVAGQEFLTADKAGLKVSAVVEYHIADPVAFSGVAENPLGSLYHAAQIALRDVIGSQDLEAIIDRKTDLSAALVVRVKSHAEDLGLALDGIHVKDIIIAGDLRKVFTEALTARQQSLVVLEKARAEAAAIRTLANAARVFEAHPALLQLKFLQAIEKAPGGIAQPLALGTAGHWLDFLKK